MNEYEYVYSPMKAANIHRDIKVYKIDRQRTELYREKLQLNKVASCFKLPKHILVY